MSIQRQDVLCDHNQLKTASVYCSHEIPEMTWNAIVLATGCEHALSSTEGLNRWLVTETCTVVQRGTRSILTTIVLEKSCKIPYVDPATVSHEFLNTY